MSLTESVLLQGYVFLTDASAHPWFLVRRRRDVPAASKSGSGAASFASSSSGSGFASGFSARSGFPDGIQGGIALVVSTTRGSSGS